MRRGFRNEAIVNGITYDWRLAVDGTMEFFAPIDGEERFVEVPDAASQVDPRYLDQSKRIGSRAAFGREAAEAIILDWLIAEPERVMRDGLVSIDHRVLSNSVFSDNTVGAHLRRADDLTGRRISCVGGLAWQPVAGIEATVVSTDVSGVFREVRARLDGSPEVFRIANIHLTSANWKVKPIC